MTTQMTDYQSFIAMSRYARWLPQEGRRESWEETVDRYMVNIVGDKVSSKDYQELREAIINLEVMPSMRAMMTAGPAFDRDNTAGYNCSYVAVDHPRVFMETTNTLMCGTGVGYSVERQYISKLPEIPHFEEGNEYTTCVVVQDSKEGWAHAVDEVVDCLYSGIVPTWDVSQVRPAGARLKVFGGRSSGPGPLVELFNFIVLTFKRSQGRKLNSLEVHDIMCKIGQIVVAGGVRRSALICLSNLSDNRMRTAKSGTGWQDTDTQRYMANNSVAYTENPDPAPFLREWLSLMESGSGERGIFNRVAAVNQAERTNRRNPLHDFGTNPCGEILLRPMQFCNLSEAVVRSWDTVETLGNKVRLAAILGTIQASYSYFPHLRKEWQENVEEERLLGVSLTGIMDNPLMTLENQGLASSLQYLKGIAVVTNKEYASMLGINQAAAVTCVKPSGTVSQLVDCSSGIHPRFSDYYIRTVRGDNQDPMTKFLKDKGVPHEPAKGAEQHVSVFSFPTESPKGSTVVADVSALDQLELWMVYKQYWCEHNPSITVYVKPEEWISVGAWVFNNFREVSGIAFLPHTDNVYVQAPYQKVTEEEEYQEMQDGMPKDIDWSELMEYEEEDNTTGSQTLSCTGDTCEIVDIT